MTTASPEVSIRGELLVSAGRVTILEADREGMVKAEVQGSTGLHTVTRKPGGRLRCNCTAAEYGRRCGHLAAVALVVTGG